MQRLLQIEYLKNMSYKPFKVFTALYFLLLALLLFIGLVDFDFFGNTVNLKEEGIYDFPGIWNFTTYIVGNLKIFLGLIVVFSITQEFSNRMFKQNIIDGLSRQEFIQSKLLTIFVFSGVSTLMVFIISLLLGYQYSTTTESSLVTEEMYFIGNYFVNLFGVFTFLMFLSIVFRKSMFVLLGFFVWWIAEAILKGIEYKIRVLDLPDKEQAKYLDTHTLLSDLMPLENMSKLIPNPLFRLNIAKSLGAEYEFTYPWFSLMVTIVWIVIFTYGSYTILKKRDW